MTCRALPDGSVRVLDLARQGMMSEQQFGFYPEGVVYRSPGSSPRCTDPRRRFTSSQARSIAERQCGLCWKCRAVLTVGYHVHHLVAWSQGGLTEVDNGIALCPVCHRQEHELRKAIR